MAINVSKIALNAPMEKVWEALTDPQKVKLWQFGSDLITTWEVGSSIRFKKKWGTKVLEQWGTVLAVNEPESLKYNLFVPRPDLEDKPENYFEMEYRLTQQGEQTLLEIIQVDNRPGAVQVPEQGEASPVLNMLKDLTEN